MILHDTVITGPVEHPRNGVEKKPDGLVARVGVERGYTPWKDQNLRDHGWRPMLEGRVGR